MKYIKHITVLVALVVAFVACDMQIEKATLNPSGGFTEIGRAHV